MVFNICPCVWSFPFSEFQLYWWIRVLDSVKCPSFFTNYKAFSATKTPWVELCLGSVGEKDGHKILNKDNSLNYLLFNIWGCVSSAYPFLLWWSWECVLYLIIIIKPEVWIINHCIGLGHETKVCAICLTMFLWGCSQNIFQVYILDQCHSVWLLTVIAYFSPIPYVSAMTLVWDCAQHIFLWAYRVNFA